MKSVPVGLLAGEFADLCGVSKDTLLYYDKIGLFSPELVAENGYRVYSLDQVHTFDLLLILRDSHLPLKQIKKYLQNRNSQEMLDLLKKQADSLKKEMLELERLYKRLELTASKMEWGMQPVQKTPYIQQRDEKIYVIVPIRPEILNNQKQRMLAVREFLHACQMKGLQGDYLRCSIISQKRLLSGCYDKEFFCTSIIDYPDSEKTGATFIKRPKGTYAVIRHYGSYQEISATYEQLMEFIREQGLTVRGNAYETELMGYIGVQDAADYVVEIAIEVGQ